MYLLVRDNQGLQYYSSFLSDRTITDVLFKQSRFQFCINSCWCINVELKQLPYRHYQQHIVLYKCLRLNKAMLNNSVILMRLELAEKKPKGSRVESKVAGILYLKCKVVAFWTQMCLIIRLLSLKQFRRVNVKNNVSVTE